MERKEDNSFLIYCFVLILIIMEDTHGVEAAFNAGRESVLS